MKKLSLDILKIRDFRLLVLVRMFSVMALQCQAVIVGWQIYTITKDPFMLGLTGLTEALPAIACALVAGHIVDMSSPHRTFLIALSILCLNMLGFLLIAGEIITVPGGNILPYMFAGVFISGLARSFIMPSSFSLLAKIVKRKEMPAASAWLGSGFQIAAIGGPAIAGIIYGGFGPRAAWIVSFTMMLCAFVLMAAIKTRTHNRGDNHKQTKREPAVKSIKEGWAFILQNPVLLSVMTLDMFAVLFGGAVAMLPAYADQILHVGSEGLGALRAAPAIGAIFTALLFAMRPMQRFSAKRLLWVVTGFGLCIIGFGLSKIFWLSMLFLMLSGAFDSVSMIIRSTIMQLLTPDHMRGRVSSVNSMFIISSNEIGAFESGVAAKFLGLVPSVVLGGVGTLLVVSVTAILSPQLRRTVIDADHEEKT
jgi:MFS family permease